MEKTGQRRNRRGYTERYIKGKHAAIQRIKEEFISNQYLNKYGSIPAYPQPVEFHVTKVKHVTDKTGVDGIMEKGGFLPGNYPKVSWWSLEVDEADITAAEERYLQSHFFNRTEAQAERQEPFLQKFTTSPAFLKSSHYGNFKFTFDLKELLHEYSKQMCKGEKPILRVYETVLYQQEIIHSVIIHSPETHEFDEHPIFQDGGRAFEDGTIVWRPEAMSRTHDYEFITNIEGLTVEATKMPSHENYVWNHFILIFHIMNEGQLYFDKKKLAKNLSACEIIEPLLGKPELNAEKIVAEMKEKYGAT